MALSKIVPTAATAVALTLGTAFAAENPTAPVPQTAAPSAASETATDRPLFANPFDVNEWYDGAGQMDHAEMAAPEHINMANPSFWLSWIDPEMHSKQHTQFMNPAMYAQFMQPTVYMEFADPANWLAWFDPENYKVLTKAETYTYWMQPGAYTHAMDPAFYMPMLDLKNYEAFINPATYMSWLDVSAYNVWSDKAAEEKTLEKTLEDLNPANIFNDVISMLN